MKNAAMAENAIQALNASDFKGQSIVVEHGRPKERGPQGNGGGGGGGPNQGGPGGPGGRPQRGGRGGGKFLKWNSTFFNISTNFVA